MAKVKVNLSEVTGSDPVPTDIYNVKITDATIRDTKAGPGTQIRWEFTIEDGEYANRKVFDNTMIVGKGAFSLENLLAACGTPVPPDQKASDLELDTDDYLGTTLKLSVSQEKVEGYSTPQNVVLAYIGYE